MTDKEIIKLKKEILEDIYSCFSFNMTVMGKTINEYGIKCLIEKYNNILKEK